MLHAVHDVDMVMCNCEHCAYFSVCFILELHDYLRFFGLTDGKYYIELTIAINMPSLPVDIPKKRPEVRCDSLTTAQTVSTAVHL